MTDHGDPFAMVRRRLLRQASIFDDPAAYAAGVEDALAAIAQLPTMSDPRSSPDSQGAPAEQASSRSPVRGVVG